MLDYTRTEIAVGIFLILGLALLGYLSISIGGLEVTSPSRYRLAARFSNVGDLKPRAPVKVAGVNVGKVEAINMVNYLGEVELSIDRKVLLPKDTIASIETAGLLGEAHVSLSPGGSDKNLADGDRITHTEPALNVADLLGRYAFGGSNPGAAPGAKPGAPDGGADLELRPPVPARSKEGPP